jgi:hypothetical protein
MGLRGSLAIQLYPSIYLSIIRIRQSLIEALLYETTRDYQKALSAHCANQELWEPEAETHEDDGESKGLLLAGTE